MNESSPQANRSDLAGGMRWLADFCSLPVLFVVMVVAELVVLVVVIAPSDESRALLPRLTTTTAFVQWLALLCAVSLCKLRAPLERLTPLLGVIVAYLVMLLISLAGSYLVFTLDQQLALGLTLPAQFQTRFVVRNAALCALIGTALLRYFYVLEQWRTRVRAEAQSRIDGLQARIRPHFLFNSMNTIASLIRTQPAAAEHAVEDLSDLFRAALGADGTPSTLGSELDLVRRYLAIEQLRLGERLRLALQFDDDLPLDLPVPALLLQPLVENAVHHGVQPLAQGGTVSVRARRVGSFVEIAIANPRPPEGQRAPSRNGMALANTRSRIEYHFGWRGAFVVQDGAEDFLVTLRFPES
jgi:two-component system sensor histidine kinase AlgZ